MPGQVEVRQRPTAKELLEQSEWIRGVDGLYEESVRWLEELPLERKKVSDHAHELAKPSLKPAIFGHLAKFAGRLTAAFSIGATIDLGRDVMKAVLYGEPISSKKARAATHGAQRFVRSGGAAYVKLGQFISTAKGILPDDVVEAFAWCRDEVPPFAVEIARQTIEEDFGKAVDDIFASFDDTPIAAASIAQVHGATLLDGSEVVVKIQRPGLFKEFEADVRTMAVMAAFAERRSSAARAANLTGFVELFGQLVFEEIDFRLETQNMVEIGLAAESAGMDYVRVPRPIPHLVSERVLVMERLKGFKLGEAASMLDRSVDRARLVRLGIQGVLEHTLVYGVFHGDLHSGNVIVDSDGQFGLLDYGIVGRVEGPRLDALVNFMIGVGTFDRVRQVDGLVEFGAIPRGADLEEIHRALKEIEDARPVDDRVVTFENMTESMAEVMRVLVTHGFRLPKELILFFKNMLYLNALAAALAPDLNLLGEIEPIFEYFQAKYENEIAAFREDQTL